MWRSHRVTVLIASPCFKTTQALGPQLRKAARLCTLAFVSIEASRSNAMSGFGRRVRSPEERRGQDRQEVALVGSATCLAGSISVQVEDLSTTGAKIYGRRLPTSGKDILIRTDELCLFGRVAWARNDQRGIMIEDRRPLSVAELRFARK
jgi:hypothetical protein